MVNLRKSMTASTLRRFVKSLRKYGMKADRRWQLDENIYALAEALYDIGEVETAHNLRRIYNELENIDSNELIKLNVFN